MKIGFLGCGNMGGALARAVARSEGGELLLADRDHGKAKALGDEISARVLCDGELPLLFDADVIFLGVKPDGMGEALWEIRKGRREKKAPLIVSMAAGVSIGKIEAAGPEGAEVIRIMPNTPVSVGEGMVLYSLGTLTSPESEALFLDIMKGAGKLMSLEERMIDKATAISGCGPAFAFAFIEAMIDGGVSIGLPYELSKALATQTVLGSAKAAMESPLHPSALRSGVCSPGGSTIAGVLKLDKGGMKSAVEEAVIASYEKTLGLGDKD